MKRRVTVRLCEKRRSRVPHDGAAQDEPVRLSRQPRSPHGGAALDVPVKSLRIFDPEEQELRDVIHARLNDPERFSYEVESDCWIYCGSWDERGRAYIRVGSRVYKVLRVSAWLYIEGFELWDTRVPIRRRSCPHPACFNPEHIELCADKRAAMARLHELGRVGRHVGPRASLSFKAAQELRQRVQAGEALAEAGEALGFSRANAARVVRGERWAA